MANQLMICGQQQGVGNSSRFAHPVYNSEKKEVKISSSTRDGNRRL